MPAHRPALSALLLPLVLSPAPAVDVMEPPILNLSLLGSCVSIDLTEIAAGTLLPTCAGPDASLPVLPPPSLPYFLLQGDVPPAFATGNTPANGLSL